MREFYGDQLVSNANSVNRGNCCCRKSMEAPFHDKAPSFPVEVIKTEETEKRVDLFFSLLHISWYISVADLRDHSSPGSR